MELTDLFQAYYDCRRHKRNTINALRFEIDYERELIDLYDEILSGRYEVGPSIAFIVHHPVKREIFAGDFRDRVVHHLIINALGPIFEKIFIHDSYSCRVGKGTLYGIRRLDSFLRSATENYQKGASILKLDIAGFFMNIDKRTLFSHLSHLISTKYQGPDQGLLLSLCEKILFNDPRENCVIKGDRHEWVGLPRNKSLFYSPHGVGLPIGNLTSQIFANLYLHPLDTFIKKTLKIRYYGRYVDDFFLIHQNPQYLRECVVRIREFVSQSLSLDLHPRKISLQHYDKGVVFLGAFIKPYRMYIGSRIKGSFSTHLRTQSDQIRRQKGRFSEEEQDFFRSSVNSYLGMMRHFSTYRLRKKMLRSSSGYLWNHFCISGGYSRISSRKKRRK